MSEKEDLKKEILKVHYEENMFKISFGDGKNIMGVRTTDEAYDSVLAKMSQYKTLYNTLRDIDSKIKYSFEEGIENTYSPTMNKYFSLFSQEPRSREEFLAYYFSENALFRLSTLWDILAQFYNIFYNLGKKL
ncbi:Cthe_2314 family HEPN domain-containing protein [Lactococcus lactis subsp. hordniae]